MRTPAYRTVEVGQRASRAHPGTLDSPSVGSLCSGSSLSMHSVLRRLRCNAPLAPYMWPLCPVLRAPGGIDKPKLTPSRDYALMFRRMPAAAFNL